MTRTATTPPEKFQPLESGIRRISNPWNRTAGSPPEVLA